MSRFLRKLNFCSKTDIEEQQQQEQQGRGGSSRSRRDAECAVCQDTATKPCTVPCGNSHVFCQACLQGLVTHNHYTTHFPCPLCRTRVRIPTLGGVAAFRQGKGGRGRRLLARLPLPRPRCRRSSTADSFSSGWLDDDLSLSDFDDLGGGGGFGGGGGYNSDSDESSMGIPSEGAGSMGELNLEAWLSDMDPALDVILPEEFRRVVGSPAPHADSPSRPRFRHRQLLSERLLRLRNRLGESSSAAAAAGNRSAVEEGEGGGGEGRGGVSRDRERGSAAARGDDNPTTVAEGTVARGGFLPDVILSDGEDLDMTVVLQLIADMEKNEEDARRLAAAAAAAARTTHDDDDDLDQEDHSETSPETPPPPLPPPPPPSPPPLGTSAADTAAADEAGDTEDEDVSLHSAATEGREGGDLSDQGDWKRRTIADAVIPRPKLTFDKRAREERGSFRSQGEEDCFGLPGPRSRLPEWVSADSSLPEDEVDSPPPSPPPPPPPLQQQQEQKHAAVASSKPLPQKAASGHEELSSAGRKSTSLETRTSAIGEQPGQRGPPCHHSSSEGAPATTTTKNNNSNNKTVAQTGSPSTERHSSSGHPEDGGPYPTTTTNAAVSSLRQTFTRNSNSGGSTKDKPSSPVPLPCMHLSEEEEEEEDHHPQQARRGCRHRRSGEIRTTPPDREGVLSRPQDTALVKEEEEEEDMAEEDLVGISREGPGEWIRRIRFLHQRGRRPPPPQPSPPTDGGPTVVTRPVPRSFSLGQRAGGGGGGGGRRGGGEWERGERREAVRVVGGKDEEEEEEEGQKKVMGNSAARGGGSRGSSGGGGEGGGGGHNSGGRHVTVIHL
ncbi:uncharacterized protein LOC143289638 [Babylonia areolata]|uniref:uncharacterized protein LOC143289638 n=1 Tax=Babylonia areolata TaxID=304850 RepID=UPI003FD518E6